MNVIVAVDKNWGIGRDGHLLFNIPEDKKFVRIMTRGRVLVMGRHTFLDLPSGKPLKDRVNIVLSADTDFAPEGAVVCRSLAELKEELGKYNTDDVFVFGGQKVYEELLPYCKFANVTKVDADGQADRFFPDIGKIEGWGKKDLIQCGMYGNLEYEILLFENAKVKDLQA